MVSVSFDHGSEESQVFVVGAHESVLVDYGHTEGVAYVEHGRCAWVVAKSDGVHAEFFEFFDLVCP